MKDIVRHKALQSAPRSGRIFAAEGEQGDCKGVLWGCEVHRACLPLRPASSMFSNSQSQLHPPVCQAPCRQTRPLPALAKLAAQLVVDLLIAGPPAAAFLIGHLLRAHAHAQHLPDLKARCRLRLWRTRRNDWQRRSSSSTRGCVRSLALRGRAARAV